MTIRTRIAKTSELPPADEWNALPMMLNEKQASVMLGVSLSFLRKSRCEGLLRKRTPAPPFVSIGGRRLYRSADLKAWVEGLTPQETI